MKNISGGGGGSGGGQDIDWGELVTFPVNTDCLEEIYQEDIIDYFNFAGKDIGTINSVTGALDAMNNILPCGVSCKGNFIFV